MGNRVGTKGQIVITKQTRDQLGIEPGWEAVESVIDGAVVLSFLPPEHARSVRGRLRRYARGKPPASDAVHDAAWEGAAGKKEAPWRR